MRERGNIPTDQFIANTLYDVLQELRNIRKLIDREPLDKSTISKVKDVIIDVADDGKRNKSNRKKTSRK